MHMTKAEVMYALQGAASALLHQIAADNTKQTQEIAAYAVATNEVAGMMESELLVLSFDDSSPSVQGSFVGEPEELVRALNKVVTETSLATDKQGVVTALRDHVSILYALLPTEAV